MYEFKTRPFGHQREGLSRSRDKTSFAFLMEMGTGKTKLVIDEAGILFSEGKIDTMLVLAPKGVYLNWRDSEIPIHMSVEHRVAVWQAGGGNKDNQAKLVSITKGTGLRIVIMNIEALGSGTKALRYAEKFLDSGRCYMTVDESTLIKNPTANRTKRVTALGSKADYRRIMTGSPVTRSPLDLWSQFAFLGSGLIGPSSFYAFRGKHAVMQRKVFGGRSVDVVVGYKNVDELGQRLERHSFRVTKDECLDLPPKVYTRHSVQLTTEQEKLYTSLKRSAFAMIEDGTISADSAITIILRLHQIVCGHVTDDDGDVRLVDSNRVSSLVDILRGASGDVVVWAKYRLDIEQICTALREEFGDDSVAEFHGGNTNTRSEDVARFKNDPDCRFMVSSEAGAYGNTWINASTNVYFSNSYDLEKRMQSEDRTHRSGQTASCQYIDMVAEGTVDEKIIQALRDKRNIADKIVDKVEILRDWI